MEVFMRRMDRWNLKERTLALTRDQNECLWCGSKNSPETRINAYVLDYSKQDPMSQRVFCDNLVSLCTACEAQRRKLPGKQFLSDDLEWVKTELWWRNHERLFAQCKQRCPLRNVKMCQFSDNKPGHKPSAQTAWKLSAVLAHA
jgi:hypothetical protein